MNELTAKEREEGWRLLFNGRTTEGWHGFRQKGMPEGWAVEGGTLVLKKNTPPGEPGKLSTGIVTAETFGDFELTLEWKLAPGGNSGLFYRVSEDEAMPNRTGPEMQILDDARHPDAAKGPERLAGACYQMYAPTKKVVRPVGEWNAVRLIARGNHIEHWLNGERIVTYEIGSPDWLARLEKSKYREFPRYGRERKGHILLQDHEHAVAFRNIKIKVLDKAA